MFEVKLAAPLNIEWEITDACNLRCRHCYANSGVRSPRELTTKEASNLVAELDKLGVSDITLSGGEPFLRNDIWCIIRNLQRRKIPFIIYTNGLLLNPARIRKLAEAGVELVSISLNGASPETHNFVQNANTYNKVLSVIRILKKEKFKVQILYTLMKINIGEVSGLVQLAKELNVDSVCFYPFYPAGRGCENFQYLQPDYNATKEILMETVKDDDINPPYISVGGCLSRYFSRTEGRLTIKGAPCAKLMAVVTSDGHLRPCNFLRYRTTYGFREKGIAELWNEPLFRQIRDWNKRIKVDCSNCERLPVCSGYCLSMHLDKLDVDFESRLQSLCE